MSASVACEHRSTAVQTLCCSRRSAVAWSIRQAATTDRQLCDERLRRGCTVKAAMRIRRRTSLAGHVMQTPILQSWLSSRPRSRAASRMVWSSSTSSTVLPASCWISTCCTGNIDAVTADQVR